MMQIREKSWFASSVKSRLQYLGPNPGYPCLEKQPMEFSLDPCTGPVDAFCLLVLDPDQVKKAYLERKIKLDRSNFCHFISYLSLNLTLCILNHRLIT